MLRILLFIIILLVWCFSYRETFASVVYTPGEYIVMTGSNNDVRFDVKAALVGFWVGAPTLDTVTLGFTGAFYGSGIGWIMFSTGIYQVELDCWAQTINPYNLTTNCSLTGTGWNENIGEIVFWWVNYNPLTGLLEWSAYSYMGDIDMSGVALPLKPVELNETNVIAGTGVTLSVSWAWLYQWSGSSWEWDYKQIIDSNNYLLYGTDGVYLDIDLSLASKYTLKIVDPNGSITEFWWMEVFPWNFSNIDESNGWTIAELFCTSNPSYADCPDGADRVATSLLQIPAGIVVADGINDYQFNFRVRDKFGNRTGSGNQIKITYDTTVKDIQIDQFTENIHFSSFDGDAFISNKFPTTLDGDTELTFNILNNIDINYTIASTAPTTSLITSPNNIIQLNTTEYISGAIHTPIPLPKPPIEFSPIYIANITPPIAPPVIGTPYSFETIITGSHPSITPTVINTLLIGDGSKSIWKDLISDPTLICTNWSPSIPSNTLCDWLGNRISTIATQTASNFIFTGSYVGDIANPDLEGSTINTYIYYHTGTKDILYRSSPVLALDAATRPLQRLRLLGQSINLLNITGWENRIDLINTIRKNTTTLSRNRNNYNNVDYTITSGLDINIDDSNFTNKRTITVVGGDITITSDINPRNTPITLVALTDENGNGGNIIINGNVKDIHSSLISERSITSITSDNQLYIRGLVSSANAPQEIVPTTCPYYLANCTPSDFDLPGSRSSFLSLSNTTGHTSLSWAIYTAPIVIETDPRLMRNPPKIILK